MKKEALYYKKTGNNSVKCLLCPHNCILKEGQTGFCDVRKNIDGKLYSLNYGDITSIALDPIEKKPFYHFYPASVILSVGSYGCNIRCPFCQNSSISDMKNGIPYYNTIAPEQFVDTAIEKGSFGIAYTYNEPIIFYEFVLETAKIAKSRGLKNVLVSNGQITPEPLKELIPYIDAVNVDLKSMSAKFYKDYIFGDIETTKNTIKILYENNIHIEVTFLVVTNKNDTKEEMEELSQFIASISKNIPLHISRYFPCNKCNEPPTEKEVLFRNWDIARKYLNFVYVGNILKSKMEATYCPSCGESIIEREGYFINNRLNGDECPYCGEKIMGEYNVQ